MPYPSKIDRPRITEAALRLVEQDGENALTLRRLARDLGVTANAVYRYFDSREALLAAAAEQVAQRLYATVEERIAALPEDTCATDRVLELVRVYAWFSRENPAFYGLCLSAGHEERVSVPQPRYPARLWDQSLAIVEPVVGVIDAPAATASLWGIVHGIWALRQAGVLVGQKPSEIEDYAFNAIISGLPKGRP